MHSYLVKYYSLSCDFGWKLTIGIGVPTRFGTFPAQMKSFLDATGALWATGALSGKFAGTFFSTASQHGGQETTAYTLVTYFAHHGLNYIPLGFANSSLFDNSEVVGGSPYGAGTVGKVLYRKLC
jgi:NAD(P)H dehydrogenase (quinone)